MMTKTYIYIYEDEAELYILTVSRVLQVLSIESFSEMYVCNGFSKEFYSVLSVKFYPACDYHYLPPAKAYSVCKL